MRYFLRDFFQQIDFTDDLSSHLAIVVFGSEEVLTYMDTHNLECEFAYSNFQLILYYL